jgi:LysM repeat protein
MPVPPSQTPTVTLTPSITLTVTASEPFSYIIQEGDSLFSIAEQFTLDLEVLLAYNTENIDDAGTIFVGQEITIPPPDAELPTSTPLPETLLPGQEIEYRVQAGDSLQSIAAQFNSTAEALAERNDIEDVNAIQIGDLLVIVVNIATPTETPIP